MKKKWEKPEIVVLVRGKPEEAVLWWCKNDLFGGPKEPDDLGFTCFAAVPLSTCKPWASS